MINSYKYKLLHNWHLNIAIILHVIENIMHIFGVIKINNTKILLLYKNNIDIIEHYYAGRGERFLYFSQFEFEINIISIKCIRCRFLFYFVQRISSEIYFTCLHYCNLFSIHSSFIIRVIYYHLYYINFFFICSFNPSIDILNHITNVISSF